MEFKLFKKIYNHTMDFIQDDITTKFKTKEELYFYEQFNQYLQIEDVLFCYQMLDEGFKASDYQKSKLDSLLVYKIKNESSNYRNIQHIKEIKVELKILALIYSMPRYHYAEDLTNNNRNEHDKNVSALLDNYKNKKIMLKYNRKTLNLLKSFYAAGIDSTGDFYKHSYEENDQMIKQYSNSLSVIAVMIRNEMLSPQEINEVKEQIKDVCDFMKKKTKTSYHSTSFNRIGKGYLDNYLESIAKYQTKYLSKDNKKEMLLKQLKSYNARNKSLSEEIKDLIDKEEYSIDKLPIEAKNKIEKINQIAQSLNNKEVNDFLHERLPIILKKYFSIDEEYRTSLKNVEGFNAQELMIQSLENIESLILAKKEDNNYDLVSELSVENRKLKMRKA